MSEKQPVNLGMTPDVLKDVLATVISEARKPAEPTAEEKAAAEQARQIREIRSKIERDKQTARFMEQKHCPHLQENGKSATVSVNLGEFLICVKCQAKIKTAKGPYDEPEQNFIYDESLYYRHLNSQKQTTF